MFVPIKNMNGNTYNVLNEMRFPISFGMFPDILLFDKFLNNLTNQIHKSEKYDMIFDKITIDIPLICLFK